MKIRWIVAALPLFVSAPTARADEVVDLASADRCTVVTPVAAFVGFAYNHTVTLKNNCQKPVRCEVWTDVDPTPRHALTVKPGETGSVLIRRGSPAREFKADKSCKY